MVCARRILGVPQAAKPAVVKSAFRALAKRWHPDLHHGSDEAFAAEQFKKVRKAYDEVLLEGEMLASSSSSSSSSSAMSRPHKQDNWWHHVQAPRPNRRKVYSFRALLSRYATEASNLASRSASALDALTTELVAVRAEHGVHVSFESTLRCSLTKRRLLMTLHEQLTLHADMRAALGGRVTFFTSAEPDAAANAMLVAHAEARAQGADLDNSEQEADAYASLPVWLSSQDTPTGWQKAASAARQLMVPVIFFRDGRAHHGRVASMAAAQAASAAPSRAPRGRQEAMEPGSRAERMRELRDLETAAAKVLGIRSLAPETPPLRVAAGYASLLAVLASPALADALRVDGGWAHAGRARAWRAVIVPRLSLQALCRPSLQPRLLKLHLPLGCDELCDDNDAVAPTAADAMQSPLLRSLPRLLNREGVRTIADTQAAHRLLLECTEALGLRACRAEESLRPSQVIRAAEALLSQSQEWRALGSEGCVISIGEAGFAMAADGVLRVQWDAV